MALSAMKPSAATGRAHEATSLAALLAGSIERMGEKRREGAPLVSGHHHQSVISEPMCQGPYSGWHSRINPSQRGRGYDPGGGQVDILLVDFDLTLGSNRTVRDGGRGGDGGSGDGGNKGAVVDIWLI
ncbi:hypothetical protein ColLi_01753 [Colletotrichum liriopes]|uniref:Uncharacterized protein n=1 Tax=Colletotrichum liriopes TaxID=708192 RepID=A0AA37GE12_9PEZI|nr:hypothetical protein ColLi_01753 [Colletotrichum liriopes]